MTWFKMIVYLRKVGVSVGVFRARSSHKNAIEWDKRFTHMQATLSKTTEYLSIIQASMEGAAR